MYSVEVDVNEGIRFVITAEDLEEMLVQQRPDLDIKSGLLPHLARERRAMILAEIGPTARQVPFAALVQQQQDAAVVDDDAFDGERVWDHALSKGPSLRSG